MQKIYSFILLNCLNLSIILLFLNYLYDDQNKNNYKSLSISKRGEEANDLNREIGLFINSVTKRKYHLNCHL